MSYGHPNLAITTFKISFEQIDAVKVGTHKISIHLVKWSFTTGMYILPLGVSGKGKGAKMSVVKQSKGPLLSLFQLVLLVCLTVV